MTPPRRLDPSRRRRQLLDTAAPWFVERPYDDVSMKAVAHAAAVSRSPLYRYFPSKRDLFVAVYRLDAAALARQATDPAATELLDRVAHRLDLHLDYASTHPQTVISAHRLLRDDPLIRALLDAEARHLRDRIVAAALIDPAEIENLTAVVTSWLVFVRTLVLDRLVAGELRREEMRTVCIDALRGALRGFGVDPPARAAPGAAPAGRAPR